MFKENEQTVGNVIEEIKKCLGEDGVEKIIIKIDEANKFPECLSMFQLDLILSELTDNCRDKGAKEITITLENNKIRVEDDVRHKNACEIVDKLNGVHGSNDKINLKKWQNIVFNKIGGIGISELVLGILEKTNGNLVYSVVDENRIAAEISWTTAT